MHALVSLWCKKTRPLVFREWSEESECGLFTAEQPSAIDFLNTPLDNYYSIVLLYVYYQYIELRVPLVSVVTVRASC